MRRIGSTSAQRGCGANNNCPDVLELEDGDFLVIGKLRLLTAPETERMNDAGASIGEDESVVLVPRDCILAAAHQLESEQVAGAG
ncbi:hypothetical protein JK359_37265 [Streptomyces actinomycinicus]|uniref:Uncharacterized protein n=1 Tax=Streptomyces actinomycinicus TaxID=1695166 RepID=A0A937EQ71_9ACTN|nr:hypothetical protein [Streptomyces actinomycinicus]MBL1087528.1 hypothetical protein [Streptomyces actinomycinicus]